MSASGLGARLLGEVRSESLDELLRSLRTAQNPTPSSRLNIPALDRLLNIFSLQQQQQQRGPGNPLLQSSSIAPEQETAPGVTPPPSTPRAKGAVIEITGNGPCAGKTQLLYYITAVSILPATWAGVRVNGKEGMVIILDTDGRFDVARLRDVTAHYLRRCIESAHDSTVGVDEDQDAQIEALVNALLMHVHILRPQSTASLIATLNSMPDYLFSPEEHYSSHRPLQAILLDSASAFFCQDRMDDESKQLQGENGGHTFVQAQQDIVKELRSLQKTFDCVIVATNWGLYPCHSENGPLSFRPHLPPVWTFFCTLRLVVEKEKVPGFGPGMSVEEALLDAEARQSVVDQGRFLGWVDRWGSESWVDPIWDALGRVKDGGSFAFTVTGSGVEVEE
ncbi:MAG: hypothetical protein M1819_007312 [Sarea resinae]|nr:MAG: hypothetical protein M1819_007312 [Sarea resinae]